MNWEYQPMSALEATSSATIYLVYGAFAHLMLALVCAPFIFAGTRFNPQRTWQILLKLICFMLVLLLFGTGAAFAWSTCVWGRFYYSTDYVFGYLPVVPITQAEIDASFAGRIGSLNGVTLTFINTIWTLFSIVVWGGTILVSRHLWKEMDSKAHTKTAIG